MMNTVLINYILMFVIGLCIPLFMFRSIIFAWIKVKMSGGSKVLIHVLNPLQDYYTAGTFDNGHFQFKARKRKDNPTPNRMVSINAHSEKDVRKYDVQQVTYNMLGVRAVDIDDIKNCIMVRNNGSYESVIGFNAEAVDETVKTALMKPSLANGMFDPKTWQFIVLGCFFLVIVGLVIVYRQVGTVDSHVRMVYDQTQYIINATMVA